MGKILDSLTLMRSMMPMRTAMNLTLLMIVMLSLSVMMNAPLHAAANKVKGRPMLQ
jgi:hypothetical protein